MRKDENRQLQDALDHRLRRNLLRVMHELDPPRTVHELAFADPGLFAEASLSEIAYHVGILERNDAISQSGELVTATALPKLYISNVNDNPLVLGVLKTTAASDGFGR